MKWWVLFQTGGYPDYQVPVEAASRVDAMCTAFREYLVRQIKVHDEVLCGEPLAKSYPKFAYPHPIWKVWYQVSKFGPCDSIMVSAENEESAVEQAKRELESVILVFLLYVPIRNE